MRSTVRWIVPVAAAGLIAGGTAISNAAADGPPSVANRTAEQVLASVAGSSVDALSGTVQTRTALGLPDLTSLQGMGGPADDGPGAGSSASALDLQGLATRFLSGANTLRVWADGPQRERVQLLDPFNELDVVRNGTTLWTYSSKQDVAGQGTLTAHSGTTPDKAAPTPDVVAKQAIASLDPTTTVSLGTPATVAGRATYALVLTPKTTATLVDHIVINVDAANGVPLRTAVYARGQADAAILTGFTSVDYARPAASIFSFTPPKSARVEKLPSWADGAAAPKTGVDQAGDKPKVIGTGWTTIVEAPAGSAGASANSLSGAGAAGIANSGALGQLATPVDGGRVIKTALLSVLMTNDGRTFAGAVPVQSLIDAAKR